MAGTALHQQVEEARAFVSTVIASPPEVAVVLGSGLGHLADEMAGGVTVPFEQIPHFPFPTVKGHAGVLVSGELSGKRVIMMRGRLHFYEGYSPQEITFPIRVLAALGASTLLVTNAAGGLNGGFRAGDIMLIADHINLPGLAGANPILGWPEEPLRSRFVSMHNAYDPVLRELAWQVAQELGMVLRQGVYAMVAGPSYETPAEARFLKEAGADAVGMSTAGEVIVARHCGMTVLGLSGITNVLTEQPAAVSHEEVLSVASVVGPQLALLIKGIIARL